MLKSLPQSANQTLRQLTRSIPNKRDNCWLNAVVKAVSCCCNVTELLELQQTMGKETASFPVLERIEIQSRPFQKRFINEGIGDSCLRHLSRDFGLELHFGRQNDTSFLLCKMIEEISAIDDTQFGAQFSEISTCFKCGKQEMIKVNAVDNVLFLPIVINAIICELIHMTFNRAWKSNTDIS